MAAGGEGLDRRSGTDDVCGGSGRGGAMADSDRTGSDGTGSDGTGSDGTGGRGGRPRISPWPDRLALIGIWLAGIVVTIVYQRPKEAGLYADFWFGALITVGMVMAYAFVKKWLGLPPITLKLKRPRR